MGRFAIGMRLFGYSSGLDVKVLRETPGPHRIRAWKPVAGTGAEDGMVPEVKILRGSPNHRLVSAIDRSITRVSPATRCWDGGLLGNARWSDPRKLSDSFTV